MLMLISLIEYAAANDHIVVVELLLQDSRVDPSADNNYAIKWAIKMDMKRYKMLINDPRLDPKRGKFHP